MKLYSSLRLLRPPQRVVPHKTRAGPARSAAFSNLNAYGVELGMATMADDTLAEGYDFC